MCVLYKGVKAIIAESYERIHRSNLVGMGLIPLQFLPGENAETLELNGRELYDIHIPENCQPQQQVIVEVSFFFFFFFFFNAHIYIARWPFS